MMNETVYTTIGLMSGTSLDGVDAALLRTDGARHIEPLGFKFLPYQKELQDKLRACLGKQEDTDGLIAQVATEMTAAHGEAVAALLKSCELKPQDIHFIGFHGQTVYHNPQRQQTWQIGNGAQLAELTGIDVINDFRTSDVKNGGQGAPLLPLYHQGRAVNAGLEYPVAILNLGGVANVTWLGENDKVLAFDTGPGNALINDWVLSHTGKDFDENGALAAKGRIKTSLIDRWMTNNYFKAKPPKSLDRDAWKTEGLDQLSLEDGAATLSAFTAQAVARARDYFPAPVKQWFVAGGGRHNPFMMSLLSGMLSAPVSPVEELGWNGDALEAEGFAYLAVRSRKDLYLTLPDTTGVKQPSKGGVFHAASCRQFDFSKKTA